MTRQKTSTYYNLECFSITCVLWFRKWNEQCDWPGCSARWERHTLELPVRGHTGRTGWSAEDTAGRFRGDKVSHSGAARTLAAARKPAHMPKSCCYSVEGVRGSDRSGKPLVLSLDTAGRVLNTYCHWLKYFLSKYMTKLIFQTCSQRVFPLFYQFENLRLSPQIRFWFYFKCFQEPGII